MAFIASGFLLHGAGTQPEWRVERAETYQAGQQENTRYHQQHNAQRTGYDTGKIQCRNSDRNNHSNEAISRTHVLFHDKKVLVNENSISKPMPVAIPKQRRQTRSSFVTFDLIHIKS
jgi:hypothetical protein